MKATLVYDNAKPGKLTAPVEMGEAARNQLMGSPLDNLAELAGRVCYDSLGAGRGSADYHAHIRDVGHLSVYEHCVFTVRYPQDVHAETFLNRPSLYADPERRRVTLNLRHVLEWEHTPVPSWCAESSRRFGWSLKGAAGILAPLAATQHHPDVTPAVVVPPLKPVERWLSFYVGGVSRNLTHELVRHGDWTAISQRSTRYCDEGTSDVAWHPELMKLLDDPSDTAWVALGDVATDTRALYSDIVEHLTARGLDRKTARGAARGVLPSALSTELIFSASLAQWRHIVALRAHPAADSEIRSLAELIGKQLPQ